MHVQTQTNSKGLEPARDPEIVYEDGTGPVSHNIVGFAVVRGRVLIPLAAPGNRGNVFDFILAALSNTWRETGTSWGSWLVREAVPFQGLRYISQM